MIDNTIAAAKASGALILLPGTIYNYGSDAFPVLREESPQNATTHKRGETAQRPDLQMSWPMASAILSTALVSHLQVGQQLDLLAPLSKGACWTAVASMRRTPGENAVFSISSSTSTGNWPAWQCGHR